MVQLLIKIKLKFHIVMLKLHLLPQFEVLLEYEGCVGLKWGKELNEISTDTRPVVIYLQIMFCVKNASQLVGWLCLGIMIKVYKCNMGEEGLKSPLIVLHKL